MTDRAPTLKVEVHRLVDLQIKTLRQPSKLTSPELFDYHLRSEKIRTLYQELDRIGRSRLDFKWTRAS